MIGNNIKYEPAFETIQNKQLFKTLNVAEDTEVSAQAAIGMTQTRSVNRSLERLEKKSKSKDH